MLLRRGLVDYHIHSNNSVDGKSSLFEMCYKAIELGIGDIGFSEHVDFEPNDQGFGFFKYDKFTSEIENAQKKFANKLVIRKGVEVDYQHCFENVVKGWFKNKKFDYIIGSVHYLNHELIDQQLTMKKDIKELYNSYFNEVSWSIKSGFFDVIGHFDVIGKYIDNRDLKLDKIDYWDKVKRILREIVERRMYLEINSKGLNYANKSVTPNMKIIKRYIENDGKLVSIGSDAHSTEEMGIGIKEILNSLAPFNDRIELLFTKTNRL